MGVVLQTKPDMMNSLQNMVASRLLNSIRPTLAGDIIVPDMGRTLMQSSIHMTNELVHAERMQKRQQSKLIKASLGEHHTDYLMQLSQGQIDRQQQRHFSGFFPKDAVRFICDLNAILNQVWVDEDSRIIATSWRRESYDRVSSARKTSEQDAAIHNAVFGFPLLYGGYICVSDDGSFVRTALDPDNQRLSLSAGRDGHYLEMSVWYWLHGQAETETIRPDLTDEIRQGYLSTTRYSFSFSKEELAALTHLPEDIDGIPTIGAVVSEISPLHMAAVQKLQQLQFGGIRVSALTFLPVEATPVTDLRQGIADQARVRVRNLLYQQRTGQPLIQPVAEANHYRADGGSTKRRTLNLYRPIGSEALMPVSEKLYDEFKRELGVKLFAV